MGIVSLPHIRVSCAYTGAHLYANCMQMKIKKELRIVQLLDFQLPLLDLNQRPSD